MRVVADDKAEINLQATCCSSIDEAKTKHYMCADLAHKRSEPRAIKKVGDTTKAFLAGQHSSKNIRQARSRLTALQKHVKPQT